MKTIKYRELSRDAFAVYGSYAHMVNPAVEKIGAEPIEFFRDMVQSSLGTDTRGSFGVCRVSKRPYIIDVSEYHDTCAEAMMPLDGDVLVHVAPAVPGAIFPFDKVEVFLVPRGTLFCMNAGVWHHGPYTLGTDVVNCLVMIPERLYARDCKVYEFSDDERIKIEVGSQS